MRCSLPATRFSEPIIRRKCDLGDESLKFIVLTEPTFNTCFTELDCSTRCGAPKGAAAVNFSLEMEAG